MVSRLLASACIVVGIGPLTARAQSPAPSARRAAPDLLLTGGRIFTADSAHPWAEALAIRGDRIVAVGSSAEVRRLAGRATREVALDGRVVIPGINDAHDHVADALLGIAFSTSASPTPDPTFAQVVDSLRALAARTPRGTWLSSLVGMTIYGDTAARRAALDRVTPDHPVALLAWWGHPAVLNSAALTALGIRDDARDPLGGWYERDARGHLTGRLDEYAKMSVERRVRSTLPPDELVRTVRDFADASVRMGVTSVQDMASSLTPPLTVRTFRDARLPIRVRIIRWSMPDAHGLNEREWDTVSTRVAPLVTVSGRKWVLDGTPIEGNSLRRTPYPNRPGYYGRLDFPVDTVRAVLARALRPGAAQLHLHVVGDSTAALVLDLMESLAPDSIWRAHRLRLEHGNGIVGPQLARARHLGIVIAQPRTGTAPLRAWLDAGIPVAYGSDGLRNPYVHMLNATVKPGGDSTQRVSREEWVRIMTRGSAFAERAEREKGMLAPGMLADVAVLSQDIFTVPARALPATTSVLTIVGGRVVRDALSPRTTARVHQTP